MKEGVTVVTGGTDNHLLLVDVSPMGLTGRIAESALREAHLMMNRNALPFDKNGPWYTSGLRMGTAALTTLGMKEKEMAEIAHIIVNVLENTKPNNDSSSASGKSRSKYTLDPKAKENAIAKVKELLDKFKLYPELG